MTLVFVVATLLRYLTLSQSNNYCLERRRPFKKTISAVALFSAAAVVPLPYYLPTIVYAVGAVFMGTYYFCGRAKFKFTKRAAPYFVMSVALCALLLYSLCLIEFRFFYFLLCISSVCILSFLSVKSAEIFFNGHYRRKNEAFIRKTADCFSRGNTKLIAITGSFGKTSCKNILYTLLSTKYKVAKTDGNFNTPMGVCLSMKKLDGDEDYFIAEFGARRKGDITQLCDLFPPDVGIITGVCMQHGEVFGSLHVIYNEKFQLAKRVKEDGFCAFGIDLYAKKMYREFSGDKISVGACEDIYAENVTRSIGKTTFDLHIHAHCKTVSTCLCGKQALDNILLCVAVADRLGVSAEEIFDTIPLIEQSPHRLEYSFVNGIHILDDSYNGNVVGVKYSLDYLKAYPSPRYVVAQGVVEMGINQKNENKMIGRRLASVADVVYVLGVNKRAIKKGLEEGGFAGVTIPCRSLKKVTEDMKKRVRPGATVLFQNDVPNVY